MLSFFPLFQIFDSGSVSAAERLCPAVRIVSEMNFTRTSRESEMLATVCFKTNFLNPLSDVFPANED